eukprot:5501181-Amphidinium_carterae.1
MEAVHEKYFQSIEADPPRLVGFWLLSALYRHSQVSGSQTSCSLNELCGSFNVCFESDLSKKIETTTLNRDKTTQHTL